MSLVYLRRESEVNYQDAHIWYSELDGESVESACGFRRRLTKAIRNMTPQESSDDR